MDALMDPVTPGGVAVPLEGQVDPDQFTKKGQQGHEQSDPQQPQQQQQTELTATIRNGLEAMSSRRQELHARINELNAVVLQFLDSAKLNFTQLIDSYRKDVDGFCDTVVASSGQEAEETLKAIGRLQRAQRLVEGLGLNVLHPDAQAGMQL